jgi:hypothetical protein
VCVRACVCVCVCVSCMCVCACARARAGGGGGEQRRVNERSVDHCGGVAAAGSMQTTSGTRHTDAPTWRAPHTRACAHTHTHIHTHNYTHAHTHTRTQLHTQLSSLTARSS